MSGTDLPDPEPRLRVFGVRHHGPGSARSLVRALDGFAPDCLLVEGPPEADGLIPFVADVGMEPPVALVIYPAENPRDAAFYPFAAFSPEWAALRHAMAAGIEARFIDLPRVTLPEGLDTEEAPTDEPDPLGSLAKVAGYADGERWWDAFVESRGDDAEGTFEAIAEAMGALRDGHVAVGREALREAHMRTCMREALKRGFRRIAVVCGAWHAPALLAYGTRGQSGEDARLLKGLPRTRMQACWAPWSYERLASAGGYAAGVDSPEWYHALWNHPGDPTARWLANAAALMRAADLAASPAFVVEAARLAGALAALRERTRPLLSDLQEAALSVLCEGDPAPMAMLHRQLVVGLRLGRVPESAIRTPVEADFLAACKSARLQPEAGDRELMLDLRQPLDLRRSHLLHRLDILGVAWGTRREARGSGTFKEAWTLKWRPEFAIDLVAASAEGATVADAASVIAVRRAEMRDTVSALADAALALLDADLPQASEQVVRLLTERAADNGDVVDLMRAIPTLASLLRYGSVRGADPGAVGMVVEGLIERVSASLAYACRSLDDEAAATMAGLVSGVENAVTLLERPELVEPWRRTLGVLSESDSVHGQVAGRSTRILSDAGGLEPGEAGRRLHLALSRASDARAASAWFEGFLAGGGAMLVHDGGLLSAVDAWLCGLDPETFVATLPLVRRTFSTMSGAERRGVRDALFVARKAPLQGETGEAAAFDHARGAMALSLVNRIFGASA